MIFDNPVSLSTPNPPPLPTAMILRLGLWGSEPLLLIHLHSSIQVEQDVLCFGHILYEMAMGYNFGFVQNTILDLTGPFASFSIP